MTTSHITPAGAQRVLADLRAALGDDPLESASRLIEPLLAPRPLRVALIGSYSVGKSSLLNALLGAPLLPTGQEEVTAVPALITAGDEESCALLTEEGERALSRDEFRRLAAGEEVDAGLLSLRFTAAAPWLRGVELFDLPGLSGNDPERAEVARAALKEADAVLYLIYPKGPQRQDVEMINLAQAEGRALKVMVTQWDRAEEAAARGERLPSLERWAEQMNELFQGSAPPVALSVTSTVTGAGLVEVRAWISELSARAGEVREERARAVLRAAIERLEAARRAEREALTRDGAQETTSLLDALTEARRALTAQERGLVSAQQQARQRLTEGAERMRSESMTRARRALDARRAAWAERTPESAQAAWRDLLNEAVLVRREALDSFLRELRTLHDATLDPSALFDDSSILSILPPAPPAFAHEEGRQMAELSRRKLEAEQLSQLISQGADGPSEELLARLAEGDGQLSDEIQTLQQQLLELSRQPTQMREEEGEQTGRMLGRMIGEVADIALMFVQPATVATKVGSMASKLGMGAKTMTRVKQATKALVAGTKGVRTTHKGIQVLGKLGDALSLLSLGHWGEKIGGMFDAPPRLVVDKEAQRARRQEREQLTAALGRLTEQRIAQQRKLDEAGETPAIQAQRARDLQRLNDEIARLEREEREGRLAEERAAREEHTRALHRRLDLLVSQSLLRLQAELNGAERALYERFKAYWEVEMQTSLKEQRERLERLDRASREAPERRAELAARLGVELAALAAALKGLA